MRDPPPRGLVPSSPWRHPVGFQTTLPSERRGLPAESVECSHSLTPSLPHSTHPTGSEGVWVRGHWWSLQNCEGHCPPETRHTHDKGTLSARHQCKAIKLDPASDDFLLSWRVQTYCWCHCCPSRAAGRLVSPYSALLDVERLKTRFRCFSWIPLSVKNRRRD